jgi:hypothetical protein
LRQTPQAVVAGLACSSAVRRQAARPRAVQPPAVRQREALLGRAQRLAAVQLELRLVEAVAEVWVAQA